MVFSGRYLEQLWQFHQFAAIRRNITKNIKIGAYIKLKAHSAMLRKTDRE
jgi:hypothetical protein